MPSRTNMKTCIIMWNDLENSICQDISESKVEFPSESKQDNPFLLSFIVPLEVQSGVALGALGVSAPIKLKKGSQRGGERYETKLR